MRRSRRGGHGGMEFGGSGEDSFVAVVVTKLTGALLFILLLTMVIMALLPKAADVSPSRPAHSEHDALPLAITTPETLPEAIAGRPYVVALAATGGSGPLKWSMDGELPEGLTFDPAAARLEGTPRAGTPQPLALKLRVSDGDDHASRSTQLVVYQSDQPLSTPAWWRPGIPPIPWRAWMEQGFGFLVLWLVHLASMNTVASLERWSRTRHAVLDAEDARLTVRKRFTIYRNVVRLSSLSATVVLAVWLWRTHA